jgi:hypothetical protein
MLKSGAGDRRRNADDSGILAPDKLGNLLGRKMLAGETEQHNWHGRNERWKLLNLQRIAKTVVYSSAGCGSRGNLGTLVLSNYSTAYDSNNSMPKYASSFDYGRKRNQNNVLQ